MSYSFQNRIIGHGEKPADEFTANPDNPRIHPQKQRDAIQGSLDTLGFIAPVIVNIRTGYLIDGHERIYQALQKGDATPVPYIEVDLSPDEEKLALATFDWTTTLADYDQGLLDSLLQSVQTDNENLQAMLAEMAMEFELYPDTIDPPDDPGAQVDKAAELQEKWQVQPGDLYRLPSATGAGEHRLLCGDCTSADDVARVLDGNKPLLMVTDPPYGVNYDPMWRSDYDDQWDYRHGTVQNDDVCDWRACYALFPGDVAYVWHAGKFAAEVAISLQVCEFEIAYQIIWNKQTHVFGRGDYHWKHEPCFYAVRKGAKHLWAGDRTQNTVWDIQNHNPAGGVQDDTSTMHGTQKPLECMARPIRNHTPRMIYDPFGGSGTTMVACEQLQRQCFMLEIDPTYCAVILERMSNMGLQPEKIT